MHLAFVCLLNYSDVFYVVVRDGYFLRGPCEASFNLFAC